MNERLLFSKHARDRMLSGGFDVADVVAALSSGETIEENEDDTRLVLGRSGTRPVHLVVRDGDDTGTIFLITVYEPDPDVVGRRLPNEARPMTCPLCRHGRLVSGTADAVMSHEGVTVVVRGVPAEVCENCGEEYFDADVTQRLLDLVRDAAAAGVVVDVRNYVAA